MKHDYVRCAQCGHDFPIDLVRARGSVQCGCGMRIERQSELRAGPSALALLLLAAAVVLLTAVAALARRLTG